MWCLGVEVLGLGFCWVGLGWLGWGRFGIRGEFSLRGVWDYRRVGVGFGEVWVWFLFWWWFCFWCVCGIFEELFFFCLKKGLYYFRIYFCIYCFLNLCGIKIIRGFGKSVYFVGLCL